MTRPRLRFAPSPTGKLHIGGARTALFAWAYARRNDGVLVLRIEDTDRERSTQEHEHAILEGLSWLGISWDEGPDVGGDFGPYRQSERSELYTKTAAELLEAGHAYYCVCPSERLEALREEQTAAGGRLGYDGQCRDLPPSELEAFRAGGGSPVLRFRVPEGATQIHDQIRGDVRVANEEVDDWIMVRGDGSPTYNFAVVCDDTGMRITHVMRGEDHLTNTPKQVLLYEALGLEIPTFAHFPLMLGTDGKKLSKRTGDTAVQDYRDNGYPPEAVLNFLCLQGWALDDKTEIFSLDDLVEHFDPGDVGKRGAIFDPEKFLWMAGEYVHNEEVASLAERCAPYVVAAGQMTEAEIAERRDWYEAAVASVRERMRLYSELPQHIAYLFAEDDAVVFDEKALKGARKHEAPGDVLTSYTAWLAPRIAGGVDADAIREDTRGWVKEQGLKMPALFQPLRCVLTGAPGGPDLFEIMALLTGERTLRRLEHGIPRLAE